MSIRNLRVVFLPRYRGNPYQTLLEDHLSRAGVRMVQSGQGALAAAWGLLRYRPHIIHLHWLDAFFVAPGKIRAMVKLAVFALAVTLSRLLGRKIVWTVHNLKDHEGRNPGLDAWCTRFVAKRAGTIIVHSESAGRTLRDRFPAVSADKIVVIPHGHYCDAYENRIERSEARRTLGVAGENLLMLFLGQIRPYKGVLELIDAFEALGHDDADLIIVGKPRDADASGLIRRRAAQHPNITYTPGFVPDDRIQEYMNASDVVVCPYRDILTSGAVVLAMSFGKACVAPRIGGIEEVLDDRGAFLYDPQESDGLQDALQRAVERRGDLPDMGRHNRQRIAAWGWDRIAEMTLKVYRGCL